MENQVLNMSPDYSNIEARPYQIEATEALKLKITDLLNSSEDGQRLLSRADLILIFTLYRNGLEEFLEDYKVYAKWLVDNKNYKVVNKPHYFLKYIIG